MKASGIKTAPAGHHVSKDERRARAIDLATNHRQPCNCGNHPPAGADASWREKERAQRQADRAGGAP